MNFPTFKKSVVGYTVADATIILAAIDPCYCCTERLTVVDTKTRKPLMGIDELIRRSHQKTEMLRKKMGVA
jgi:NADH-quinone oxidoreductase subunit D